METVKIRKDDGTIEVHHYKLVDRVVMLEPDVLEYYPDSEAVNKCLSDNRVY
ncbi:MAG: hypothetical protein ACE5I1_09755 [bacterium]